MDDDHSRRSEIRGGAQDLPAYRRRDADVHVTHHAGGKGSAEDVAASSSLGVIWGFIRRSVLRAVCYAPAGAGLWRRLECELEPEIAGFLHNKLHNAQTY